MTELFDFVCYAVGLIQMQWRKFLPGLVLGIAVFTPPVEVSLRMENGCWASAIRNVRFSLTEGMANTLKINPRALAASEYD